MAIAGRHILNAIEFLEVDVDPTTGLGLTSTIGSLAMLTTTGAHYRKTGSADTAWSLIGASSVSVGIVQKRRSTTYAASTSWANLTFDVTDTQTDASVASIDAVNADRILLKETGVYEVYFNIANPTVASGQLQVRVLVNNTTVIPGTLTAVSDYVQHISSAVHYSFTAGDFVTVQLITNMPSQTISANALFSVERSSGPQGAQGTPGGSSFAVKQNGATISSNISSIDFNTPNLVVGQPSPGVITVTAPVFGGNYAFLTSDGISTTSSISYQNKVTLSTGTIPAGTYRIGWYYNWYYTNGGRNFDGRILVDAATSIMVHLQQPTSTATTLRHAHGGWNNIDLTAGTHSITLDYRSSNTGDTAGILNARLEFWRVS